MDLNQLVAAIVACTNPDSNIRKSGEEALNQQHLAPQGLLNLLRVAVEDSLDLSVRQVAAIYFKNAVKKDWEHRDNRPSKISPEDRAAVRSLIVDAIVRSPPIIRVQLEEAVKILVASDFPDQWPDLLPNLLSSLTSGNQSLISGALRIFRIITRKYEYRDEADRIPLFTMVEQSFPPILALFQTLLSNPSPSPDLAELLKLCCKIFWSSCYMDIPPTVVREDQFSGWMGAFLALAAREVPTEGCPQDLELRKQWPWWKCKKWTYHVAYRLFTRYGDPKKLGNSHHQTADATFATRWKNEQSTSFLHAVLHELSHVAQGQWVAPRVSNLLLQYVTVAVQQADTWKVLKPHVHGIVQHAVMPVLAFDQEDAELWEEDPQEYVRKGYDVIEDIYSSKTAAMGMIEALCNNRKKSQLDPIMGYIVSVMNECSGAIGLGPTNPQAQAAARRLDGALLAVGTLSERLKKEPRYRAQLDPMLQQHVVPLFSSPFGHLRGKGCWLAGLYADSPFADGLGRGQTFTTLLQCVITALNDPDLPVRVDAAVAVRSFVHAIESEDLGPLRPLVPDLLQRFLAISHEVESEDLTSSLEIVVERFGSDMGPYAVGVVSALVQQFWKAVADEEAAAAEVDQDTEASDFHGSSGALAGYSILSAISTVLDAISTLPELYPQLEELLFPIMDKFTSQDGLDIFEEITQMITYLTYFSPSITSRMWTLYPKLLHCVNTWAVDYWRDVLLPVDNYISKGTETFLSLNLLEPTNRVVEKALQPRPLPTDKTGNGNSQNISRTAFEELEADSVGTESANEGVICAAQLISVVLQNARGLVDSCIPPYLTLIVGQIHYQQQYAQRNEDYDEVDKDVLDALLIAGADALYYNAALTLNTLASSGTLQLFMSTLAGTISDRRKDGKMRHFSSKREKKILALGLSSMLAVPATQLPAGVSDTLSQIASAVVHLLLALKQQEDNKAGKVEVRSEASDDGDGGAGSGNISDDEDESDFDDNVERLMAKYDGSDWDSDDDWNSEDDEDEIGSPIDTVSPYIFIAEILHAMQSTDPTRFAAIMGGVDPITQAGMQSIMTKAAELKNSQSSGAK